MSFMQLFKQSNFSLDKITGNVIKSSVEQLRGNKVLLNTGLKEVTTCFLTECFFVQKELSKSRVSKRVGFCCSKHQVHGLRPKLAGFAESSALLLQNKKAQLSFALQKFEHINLSNKNKLFLLSKTLSETPAAPSACLQRLGPKAVAPSTKFLKTPGPNRAVRAVSGVPTKHKKYCIVRVDNVASSSVFGTTMGSSSGQLFGEPQIILPKRLHKMRRRILIWSELVRMWKSETRHVNSNKYSLRFQSTAPNLTIRGFILNSVKGGYAVGIAGNIAFLPKSLRRGRKIYRGQWRMFSILNMNPKLRNIVVKQHVHGKSALTPSGLGLKTSSFSRNTERSKQQASFSGSSTRRSWCSEKKFVSQAKASVS
jgi:hypothetical protein